MCGIVGLISPAPLDESRLVTMRDTLNHRGPDDSGTWLANDGRVGFGHTRLAILDLSLLGHNPMQLDDGRLWITYNGEIYNFQDLRLELESEGYRFRSHSDTEVVLAAYDRWGVACLQRFVGMFAFGIWDQQQRRLFLARDRMGQKPLYYAQYRGAFSFASELKALLADPEFPREIDHDAISMYLRYWYVPVPHSPFQHARKLPPGHYAIYEAGHLSLHRYWDPIAIALDDQTSIEEDPQDHLNELLQQSTRSQMISDVPLGAFLSGGIDSSLIVALMQEQSAQPVKTFTIRFENPAFNEADYARQVAQNFGTEHHEETVGVKEMTAAIDLLPTYFDEPFADASAIPTYILSHITRQLVTVALSGDGGDELFFGYHRYHNYARKLARSQWRETAARLSRQLMPDRSTEVSESELNHYGHWNTSLTASEIAALSGRRVPNSPAHSDLRRRLKPFAQLERAPLLDLATYLPDQILTKVDRASMAASLEVRSPFLDHRLIEFVLRLPLACKWRNGQSKWLLRQILYKRLAPGLVDREKMGFSVPLADLFRTGLRERIETAFGGTLLDDLGLEARVVRSLWSDFLLQKPVSPDVIWSLFTLSQWVNRWIRGNPAMLPNA